MRYRPLGHYVIACSGAKPIPAFTENALAKSMRRWRILMFCLDLGSGERFAERSWSRGSKTSAKVGNPIFPAELRSGPAPEKFFS